MSVSISKPKIHRLPSAKPLRRERSLVHYVLNYRSTTKLFILLSGMMVAVVFSVILASRFIPAGVGVAGNQDRSAFLSSPISDAMASSSPVAVTSSKTIVLRDHNNAIIGQMAKDPETRRAAEDVRSTSMEERRRPQRSAR